ncbi:uncharacterized protein K460DRAFT_371204 [Cucurbitaria berberidis CBS 394.84]|uniref:Uncharacterized protein n=1 Tax=Cucurbitaria berberidis CBS 394.84 TaxID=1168544 RepID=A0A9P4L483_9PLEO|nr:uncharacterized protein K460DRAFT_371204 [Cucurbitaria berberidis CBS 394.84]KAF1841190.1 hypothetical protein K460DRAFT_371204 [Cucurbitaria berberidis CBS 394.84]
MLQTSRTQFFYLSALGIWGLWGYAFFNGMFDRLDTVTSTLRFPDGRPLRSSYTNIAPLDAQLTLLSAFYDVLTNSLTSGPRLLFFDVNYAVACANVWVLIESRRRGVRSWFLRYPTWAMVLCNANGAAIVLPLYLYLVCRSKARLRDASVPRHDAAALLVSTVVILLQPLLIFVPAWIGRGGSDLHHVCIALFQAAPIGVLVLHLGLASILPRQGSDSSASSTKESKKWIVASLILAGTVAAAVHSYTCVGALLTRDGDVSLRRLFVPARGFSDPIKALPKVSGSPAEYMALVENLHLFSQWDWIVVALTSILYSHLLLSHQDGAERAKVNQPGEPIEAQELVYLTTATVILGPGAAGSFALAIREARI